MARKLNHRLWGLLLCVLLLAGCKPGVPGHVIQPDEMESILYDCFLADGIANEEVGTAREYNIRLYRLGVFKKHGISEAEFDSAMVYYTRHADELHAILDRLSQRMGDDALALGADVSEVNRMNIAEGDTANIWTAERSFVLLPQPPYNLVSFQAQADSSYHKGDRFVMSVDTRFLYQDGARDAVAQLAVCFSNDSVGTRIMHMSSNSKYTMEVSDKDSLGIKSVRAFVFLTSDRFASSSTLKVMVANNVRIIKSHNSEKKKEDKPVQKPASEPRKLEPAMPSMPVKDTLESAVTAEDTPKAKE